MTAGRRWVTVAVPTRGRPEPFAACVAALALAAAPVRAKGFAVELLVADGGTEGAAAVLGEHNDAFDAASLLAVPAGVSAARTALGRAARGELVVYCDDDVRVDPGALAELLVESGRLAAAGVTAAVAARVRRLGHVGDDSTPGVLRRDGYGGPVPVGAEPDYLVSALLAVPRTVADAVPWVDRFAEAHLDDVAWSLRAREAGVVLRWAPAATAGHGPRKGRPPARLSGHQAWVTLARWSPAGVLPAGRSWLLGLAKTTWWYRWSPLAMATAAGWFVRGTGWYVADSRRRCVRPDGAGDLAGLRKPAVKSPDRDRNRRKTHIGSINGQPQPQPPPPQPDGAASSRRAANAAPSSCSPCELPGSRAVSSTIRRIR